jgi:endonuclease YncB( thermonuclease family)
MRIKIVLFLLISSFYSSQTYTAKVIKVKDGDSIDILLDGTKQSLRLAHIDCPEKRQDYGAKAKEFTSNFCFGKEITVTIAGKPDRYGRWIVEVFRNNQNLNKELVRNGLAWHFKKYSNNANYDDLEKAARAKKIGLWKDSNPIAPWEWRKQKKAQQKMQRLSF